MSNASVIRLHPARLLAWAALTLVATLPAAAQQVVRGVVRDSTTGTVIEAASVEHLRGGEVRVRSATGAAGEFMLRLEGEAPYDVRFSHIGYEDRHIRLTPADIAAGPLDVRLVTRATRLDSIAVQTGRSRLAFPWRNFVVTEEGLFWEGEFSTGCMFLALDSVVIRDPALFQKPSRDYWPSGYFYNGNGVRERIIMRDMSMTPRVAAYQPLYDPRSDDLSHMTPRYVPGDWRNDLIRDARLQRDAWPCGLAALAHTQDRDFPPGNYAWMPTIVRRDPQPDAPVYRIAASSGQRLVESPAVSPVAVGAAGRVALALPTAPIVQLFGADGQPGAAYNFAANPVLLKSITHIGWVGDTLWVGDAATGRVALVTPDGEPIVRVPALAGAPPGGVPGARTDAFDPDLKIARPLPGGGWLAVQMAAPAPSPPRLEQQPARRIIAALMPDGRMQRVLGSLASGAWRLDIGVPDTPEEPFTDHPLWAMDPAGQHVTVVDRRLELASWMEIYRVTRIGMNGDTLFHVERKSPFVKLSDARVRSAAEKLAGHPSVIDALPDALVRRTLIEKTLYRPKHHPPIAKVVVGLDGTTWLRWPHDRDGPVRWDVLDGRGQPLRTVMIDSSVDIVAASGERVWAWVPDGDAGVAFVEYSVGAAAARWHEGSRGALRLMQTMCVVRAVLRARDHRCA